LSCFIVSKETKRSIDFTSILLDVYHSIELTV
jgi:hypothetical protein